MKPKRTFVAPHRDGGFVPNNNVQGRANRRRRSGYVFIALSLSIFFLIGMVGLAMDLGRMYVVKNESQSFCDSAAMFAAKELDGTADGITKAVNKVAWVAQDPNGPQKRLEFNSRAFQNVTTTFATTWNATTWVDAATAASDPTNYYFVRVQTQNPVSLWFLPVIVRSTEGNVGAFAVAGRAVETNMVQGIAPFAPIQLPDPGSGVCTAEELVGCSFDLNDKFGMQKGKWYTLRWLAGNLDWDRDSPNFCPGDRCPCMLKLANISGAASAGYALYGGASDVRQAIVGTPPLSTPITEGSVLDLQNGQLQTEMNALDTRVMQDSDYTSNHYLPEYDGYPGEKTAESYAGNGRRIVVVPVQSAAGAADGDTKTNTVVGFAAYLLAPAGTYSSGHASTVAACAQYLNAFTVGVPDSGGNGHTVYTLRLYQ